MRRGDISSLHGPAASYFPGMRTELEVDMSRSDPTNKLVVANGRECRPPRSSSSDAPKRTNDKAERFIRTLLGSWVYGATTAQAPNARPRSPAGSTGTHPATTALSATSRRSLASTR